MLKQTPKPLKPTTPDQIKEMVKAGAQPIAIPDVTGVLAKAKAATTQAQAAKFHYCVICIKEGKNMEVAKRCTCSDRVDAEGVEVKVSLEKMYDYLKGLKEI